MTESSEPVDARDVATLGALAGLYGRLDPVPAGIVDRIEFALTVQSMEAEVAELVQAEALAVRGDDHTRTTESVTFASGRVSLMVTTTASGDGVRIDGWVTGGGARVDVTCADRVLSATADRNGRFVVDDVPHGSVMFVIRLDPDDPEETPVVTPRIEV
ncbi:hypothetical protein [Calidifontibacter terrae]